MISKIAARRLRELYLDQNVNLYLRDMNIVTVNEQQQEVKISPVMEGLVIDIDENFFYLGSPDGDVFKTVPHECVGPVEIAFVGGELLDSDFPSAGEDVH